MKHDLPSGAQRKTDIVALLGALCFFFSTIEYMIPKPLPFLRLGLANLPILIGMELLAVPQLALVVLIKVTGQGLIGGTLFSYIFLFSAAGTVSSAALMIALRRVFPRSLSYAGISIAGALCSNTVQLFLARYIIFGQSAWLIAPPFIAIGTVTSLLLGLFANYFASSSRWLAAEKAAVREPERAPSGPPVCAAPEGPEAGAKKEHPLPPFLTGLAILLVLLFAPGIYVTAGCFVCIVAIVLISGRKIKFLPFFFMSASIIIFNLLAPSGKVLVSVFGLQVTAGALLTGVKKALTVEGMIFLSRWMIRPSLRLPGSFGRLVSRSFTVLEQLSERKEKFSIRNPVASIDAILMSLPC